MKKSIRFLVLTLCVMAMAVSGCKDMRRGLATSSDRDELEAGIAEYNRLLPEAVDEGMMLTECAVSGDRVIYKCEMDEDLYDIDLVNENLEDAKEGIMDMFREDLDDDTRYFLQLIVDQDMDLVYRYYGRTSGDKADVIIKPDELRRLLKYY